MTRQKRYKAARAAEHKCIDCGKKAVTKIHCEKHRQMNLDRVNKHNLKKKMQIVVD